MLRDRLLENYGLMIRECSNKIGSSEQYLRLAVQSPTAVDILIPALHAELQSADYADSKNGGRRIDQCILKRQRAPPRTTHLSIHKSISENF